MNIILTNETGEIKVNDFPAIKRNTRITSYSLGRLTGRKGGRREGKRKEGRKGQKFF